MANEELKQLLLLLKKESLSYANDVLERASRESTLNCISASWAAGALWGRGIDADVATMTLIEMRMERQQ